MWVRQKKLVKQKKMINEKGIVTFKEFVGGQSLPDLGLNMDLGRREMNRGPIKLRKRDQSKRQAIGHETPNTAPYHQGFGQRGMNPNRKHQNLIAAQHKKVKHGMNPVEWMRSQDPNSAQEIALNPNDIATIRTKYKLDGDGRLGNSGMLLRGNRLIRANYNVR